MQDAVRPNDEAFKRLYAAGYQTWLESYERATANPFAFPHSNMAKAFPNHPYLSSHIELDRRSASVLQATGRTVWKTTDSKCDLPSLTMKTNLQVTATSATRITLDDGCSTTSWNQFGDHGSYIPILTLAWAYVISARWAEMIPDATMEYTNNRAPISSPSEKTYSNSTALELGNITDCALRWWQAVLGAGEGWNASVPHNNRNLKSPWSVSLQFPDNNPIILKSNPAVLDSHAPASYTTATDYILAYVAHHNISDQSRAAFGAALLLPTRRRISKPIHWARPQQFPAEHCLRAVAGDREQQPPWGRNEQQLDKLLTMSCNATGLQSILSSSFIEPDLACNICGAWLQGAFQVLDMPSAQEPAILAQMLMQKSPHLDFLWLGAVLVGVQHHIMKWARPVAYLIDLQAAAWTDTFVSFIQESVFIDPASKNDQISRADEARLMFLAQSQYHRSPPLVPFAPFGFIALKDCILDVQQHATCAGQHGLRYAGMSWVCKNKTTIFQSGTAALPLRTDAALIINKLAGPGGVEIPYSRLDRDRDCSQSMTRNVFTWLRDADGYPVAEESIRKHEWISDEFSSDEEGDAVEGDSCSSMGKNLGPWLSKVFTTRSYTL